MSELTQQRINFIERLHETFLMRKGHGAYAFISTSDAVSLFNNYLETGEPAEQFINQFVRSF